MGGENSRWSFGLPNSMCLPNLVSLRLFSVSFNDDEYLTNKFFLSFPNLKCLILVDVEFLHMNINICCLKLKSLTIDNCYHYYGYCNWPNCKFKLHAPGLVYFSCKDYLSKDYILENLSSLAKAEIDMKLDEEEEEEDEHPGFYSKLPAMRKQMYARRMMQFLIALISVEDLKLSALFLEVVSKSLDILKSEPAKLCNLTCLRLETWLSADTIHAIAYFLKISPNIKSLYLEISQFDSENTGEFLGAETSLQCSLDKLEIAEMKGAIGCANELKFLEVLLKKAKFLKRLVVCTITEHSLDRQKRFMKFTERLLMFPRASANITILFF